MNRRRREARAELVRQYLETITSDDQRLVCFFLMRGLEPEDICRQMKISRDRFDLIKRETAIEMRNFGLAPEDWFDEEATDAI
ncbi:MAG: hypothetical protein ACOX6W_02745 [Lentisphaeria bacterium]|jgi:hypothetical protein